MYSVCRCTVWPLVYANGGMNLESFKGLEHFIIIFLKPDRICVNFEVYPRCINSINP